MIPKRNLELMRELRLKVFPEETVVEKPKRNKVSSYVPPKSQREQESPYTTFLRKYNDLENTIESFKTRDFVYFFRQVAEDSGYKYVISNIKKDMCIFKRLSESYTPTEICCMVEFLYQSEQDYLDKSRLSPNILASQWVNTIYADMQLWVEDEYTPKSKKKHIKREWTTPVSDLSSSSEIGEWE